MKTLPILAAALPLISAQASQIAANAACKLLPVDAGWPSEADWKAALPGAVARGPQKAVTRPDYRMRAKTVDDVVNAVKFAAKNNIRLSAIASGHDGLARYGRLELSHHA